MIIETMPQGSPEWFAAKLGVASASNADKILTPTGKPSAQWTDYIYRLVAERHTGETMEDFKGTYWTERGDAMQPEARRAYEFEREIETHAVGFVYKDEDRLVGCSPDWMCGPEEVVAGVAPGALFDGICELKCPSAPKHLKYLLGGAVAKQYMPQTQFQLWVTGAAWLDFMSYHPDFPPLIVRVEPDEKWQKSLDEHMPTFLGEMLEARRRLEEMTR